MRAVWLALLLGGCIDVVKHAPGPRLPPADDCVAEEEVCDGLDNDCDGLIDERGALGGTTFYADRDGDGVGDDNASASACVLPSGYVTEAGDCDDSDPSIYSGADEACDGRDHDCDGGVPNGAVWFEDLDGDGAGDPASPVWSCDPTGLAAAGDDCDDANAQRHPGASESCSGVDDDCNGLVDDGVGSVWFADGDGDGYGQDGWTVLACSAPAGFVALGGDCDDSSTVAFPGGIEICDGLDNDCDGTVDVMPVDPVFWYSDSDGDGFGAGQGVEGCVPPADLGWVLDGADCNDANDTVFPGASERCDLADDDCNGQIDDSAVDAASWFSDLDDDGFGDAAAEVVSCQQPARTVGVDGDCDDGSDVVHPGASELCDGRDDDCDGLIDDGVGLDWFQDVDGDGYGNAAVQLQACEAPSGFVSAAGDCDDSSAAARPGGVELCDGLDNDCEGTVDQGVIAAPDWYADVDGDGFGAGVVLATGCSGPTDSVSNSADCDDTADLAHPGGVELCDGLDNDCEGSVDGPDALDAHSWYADDDGDGYGWAASLVVACVAPNVPSAYVADATDCDDSADLAHPGGTEVCGDGLDNDCEGSADGPDASDASRWYPDADGDGYGLDVGWVWACTKPSGFASLGGDCDDLLGGVHPSQPEACDGDDTDCNGLIDDGPPLGAPSWYLDGDADGHGDPARSVVACVSPAAGYLALGDDCDDSDPAIFGDADGDGFDALGCSGGDDCRDDDLYLFPESGACALGRSCDEIFVQGLEQGDGVYLIDPDDSGAGASAFDVACHFGTDNGGWTLLATNDWGGSFSKTAVKSSTLFGSLSLVNDYKSPAWNGLLFRDLYFENGNIEALYNNVSDGSVSYYDMQAAVPQSNVGAGTAWEWPMTSGSLTTAGSLCSTNLYMHPCDKDGGNSCGDNNQAYGPAWSNRNNATSCGFDDPDFSSFRRQTDTYPWGTSAALRMWAR